MTIKFADPGWDWLAFGVVGIILASVLVLAGIFEVAYRFRSQHDSPLGNVALGFFLGSLVVAVVGFGTAPMFASSAYDTEVKGLLYEELEKVGFDAIYLTPGEERGDPNVLTGTYKGEKIVGTVLDLKYPIDHAYLVEFEPEREK